MSKITWQETVRDGLPAWDLYVDGQASRYWVRLEGAPATPDPKRPYVVMRRFWLNSARTFSRRTLAEAKAKAITEEQDEERYG